MPQIEIHPDLTKDLTAEAKRDLQQALARLPLVSAGDSPIQTFLGDFLHGLIDVYAANAGAIWFWAPDWKTIRLTAHAGTAQLGLDQEHQQAHEQLLRYALKCKQSVIVKPFSAPTAQATVSNPTDSFLLLGPVRHQGDTIGVVELFLGPKPVRGRTERVRRQYLRLLNALLVLLNDGVQSRVPAGAPRLQSALAMLASIDKQIAPFQEAIRQQIENAVNTFEGWRFGGVKENREFASQVHQLLDKNGLRVECPECGAPAILRCQAAGNAKSGVFFYDHYLPAGRTSHGGSTAFPRVKLTIKPPRRPGGHSGGRSD